jgi:2,4-dienoyl-CoA reductase-like NADH-dependent reductase (Old Yellow Enzyme family)
LTQDPISATFLSRKSKSYLITSLQASPLLHPETKQIVHIHLWDGILPKKKPDELKGGSMEVKHLASPLSIGIRSAPNRFAILPAERNDGENNGAPSERTVNRYKKFAEGGAGVVFVEATAVDFDARARKNQLVINDETAKGFERLFKEVRQTNEKTLCILQLDHGGSLANPSFSKAVSVYPIKDRETHLLSDAEIEEVSKQFIHGAVLAEETGAGGVDIKQAHGFLGSEFIRPANTREGAYGGTFQNRTRFFRSIVEGIKEALVHESFLLGTRLSAHEGIAGGFGTSGPDEVIEDLHEPIKLSKLMQELRLHFVSVSAGNARGNLEILRPTKAFPDGVYRHFGWARTIKQAVDIPVIGAAYSHLRDGKNNLAGQDREKKSLIYWAEKNLKDGNIDLVGIGRQAIADALFPRKVLNGDFDSIDFCLTCLGCSALLGSQEKAGCVVYDDFYKEIYERLNT